MAGALGVSRMTLRQALNGLESKGLLVRKRGRWGGSFVARPRFDYELSGLPGFTEQMRRSNALAGARVIEAATVQPEPEVRAGAAAAPQAEGRTASSGCGRRTASRSRWR